MRHRSLERAAALLSKLSTKGLPLEDLARAAWPKAVGDRLGQRTRAIGLVRRRLVVEVEDAIWQRQLTGLQKHILQNLDQLLGPGQITELEFRIVIERRPVQREEAAAQPSTPPGASGDEAERIADPVFRRLYRKSRREHWARQVGGA